MPPRKAAAGKERTGLQWATEGPNSRPMLDEVRVHRKNGLTYIYEFIPGKDRAGWLRYDTWVWGAWSRFPNKLAHARDLRRFNRERLHLADGEATFLHSTFE